MRLNDMSDSLTPLRLALWRPVTSTAALAWTEIITSTKELDDIATFLLGGIDHPTPLEAYIRWPNKHKYLSSFWDERGEAIDPVPTRKYNSALPIEADCRDHVWGIVANDEDIAVRRDALRMWWRAASTTDLPRMWKIAPDDPLFDDVLKMRLKLRDRTAAPLLIEKIRLDPSEWCRFAPLLIDQPNVFDALRDHLGQALESQTNFGYTDSVFIHLPHQYLTELVRYNKNAILNRPRAWPKLWESNEPESLRFVQQAIRQANEEDLRYFFSRTMWIPITSAMLNAITPVLHKFDDDALKRLGWSLAKQGKLTWIQKHIPHVIEDQKTLSFAWLTSEGVIKTLKEAAEHVPSGRKTTHRKTALPSLEISVSRGDHYVADIVQPVRVWIGQGINANEFTIAARMVSLFGNANDIDWWVAQEPDESLAIHRLWCDALFQLKRKKWQGSASADDEF